MVSDLTDAKHAAQLGFIEGFMADLGFDSVLVERSEQVPISLLVTQIPREDGDYWELTFLYVPVSDDEFEHIELLQIYCQFHAKVTDQTQAATEKLLTQINNHMLPIGRLGIGDNNEIFCRYVLAAPKYDMLDQEVFSETVQLFIYMLDKIGQTIEKVAAGQIDLQPALNELMAEG
jgi:hypothetical protein